MLGNAQIDVHDIHDSIEVARITNSTTKQKLFRSSIMIIIAAGETASPCSLPTISHRATQ
jgi:hypothetical protein